MVGTTILVVAGFFRAGAANAQEVRIIPNEISCKIGAVERFLLATITDQGYDDGALMAVVDPQVNSDGTFLVVAGGLLSELYLADKTGTIIQPVGQKGEGPGEYRGPIFLVHELPTEFLVFDQRMRRVTRLDKTTLDLIDTAPLPAIGGATPPAVFEDGTYVMTGQGWMRDLAGNLFHVVSRDGEIIKSYDRPDSNLRTPARDFPTDLPASRDGTFWAGYLDEYRFERWDRERNLLAVYDRQVEWFSNDRGMETKRTDVPQHRVDGFFEDDQGRLWVHIYSYHLLDPISGRMDPDPASRGSIVEVLDPEAGVVLASARIEGLKASSSMGGFHPKVPKSSEEGFITVEMWGARLTGGVPTENQGGENE